MFTMLHPGGVPCQCVNWTILHELKAYAHGGTAYPCHQQDLEVLQDPNLYPSPMDHQYPPIAIQDACRRALTFLRGPKSPSRRAAIGRLNSMYLGELQPERWTDIIFKTFNDLDEAFFGGILRNRIFLCWGQGGRLSEPRVMGMTISAGHGRSPRVSIHLSYTNMIVLHRDNRDRMAVWETLVHEMIHAYFQVSCHNAHELQSRDPEHGHYFRKLMRELRIYSGVNLSTGSGAPNRWFGAPN